MSGENMFGTHGDGHPCSEYCRNCFQKGFFTAASLDEQQKAIAVSGLKGHADLSNLKRWMPAVQQAAGDLDRFFAIADEQPGVRCETVEKDAVYNLYFLECTCGLHKQGYVSTPMLCECSRQSILYVLHSLWKDRRPSL